MKLYVTATSPYARIVRAAILENGLSDRVEILEAKTRQDDSPYYAINPSGRVPYLVTDDGVGLEDSSLLLRYLDHLGGHPRMQGAPTDADRLEALARSMLDGLAVWARELRRPDDEQSPTIVAHEAARSRRFADLWEAEIDHPALHGDLNYAQLTLQVALELEARITAFDWREGHPRLCAWSDALAQHPSLVATR